jgi:hypothetical protein
MGFLRGSSLTYFTEISQQIDGGYSKIYFIGCIAFIKAGLAHGFLVSN